MNMQLYWKTIIYIHKSKVRNSDYIYHCIIIFELSKAYGRYLNWVNHMEYYMDDSYSACPKFLLQSFAF